MRVLFTISMLALVALLWASISTARHIYRVRQRHRNAIQGAAAHKTAAQQIPKK
jgi:heme exporter protein D